MKKLFYKNERKIFHSFAESVLIIILSLPACGFVNAQTNSSWHLSASVQHARCLSDGGITCTLSDTVGMHLEQIKYSYIPYSGQGGIYETSLSAMTDLWPGKYKVKVTALMPTDLSQGQSYVIVSDSVDEVRIESTYKIPSAGVLRNIYTFNEPAGIVPSFSCVPTGKFQIQMINGVFPYTVEIYKKENDTLQPFRTVVYEERMYSGEDDWRYDYKDYYSIEDVGVGDYQIVCHDGCGYYMPVMEISVPEVVNLTSAYYLIGNAPESFSDYNIIKFKELLNIDLSEQPNINDDYYRDRDNGEYIYEYRFVNPILHDSTKSYTSWRKFPMPDSDNNVVFFYDTVSTIQNYGDLWGQNIGLQIRSPYCPDDVETYTYRIELPMMGRYYSDLHVTSGYSTKESYDTCGYHQPHYRYFGRLSLYTFKWAESTPDCEDGLENELSCMSKNMFSVSNENPIWSYSPNTYFYYTLPFHCRIFNLSADTVVLPDKLVDSYRPNHVFFKYDIPWDLSGDSLLFEFSDDKGAVYYSQVIMSYFPVQILECGTYLPTQWTAEGYEADKYPNEDYCNSKKRGIWFEQLYGSDSINGGQVVPSYLYDSLRVIESPENNHYNFTAAYKNDIGWMFIEKDLSNTATLRSDIRNDKTKYPVVIYEDYDMPSGYYKCCAYTHCLNKWDTFSMNLCFNDPPFIVERPQYQFIEVCSEMKIVPLAGKFDMFCDKISRPYFQISKLGTTISYTDAVGIGDTLHIGAFGDYVLSMFAYPNDEMHVLKNNFCFRVDTIVSRQLSTIDFDYLSAYVCNESDSMGCIRARGRNGIMPYHYIVYDGPNGSGNVIAENEIGDFTEVPMSFGKMMSIQMRDACGAYFVSNFKVHDMEHTRKCWAEDKLNELSMCEGSICHLYGLSLGDVTYHWTGPDDFSSDEQNVNLNLSQSSNMSGRYYISIEGSGCSTLYDSVSLSVIPAPKVEIMRDTVICPGQEVILSMMASGSGLIDYDVLRQDGVHPDDTLHFSGRSDGELDTIREPIFVDQTHYSVVQVKDEHCVSQHPDDMVKVWLKSQSLGLVLSVEDDSLCPDETAELVVNSPHASSFQVQWYEDSLLSKCLRTDEVEAGLPAVFSIPELTEDTTLYAFATETAGCPRREGTVYGVERMHSGNRIVPIGGKVLFYDSGGPDAGYSTVENSQFTFHSADSLTPLQIRFDYFIGNDSLLNDSTDCLYLFDADTVNNNPDMIIRGRHCSDDTLIFIAHSGYLTCWFVSRHLPAKEEDDSNYNGWQAEVSTLSPMSVPTPVSAKLKTVLSVNVVNVPTINNDTLKAVVSAGSNFHYRWETSQDQEIWTEIGEDDDQVVIEKSPMRFPYYRVIVTDALNKFCPAQSDIVSIDVPGFVNLSLEYLPLPESVYSGEEVVALQVKNTGNLNAEDVQIVQQVNLPGGVLRYDTTIVVALTAGGTTDVLFPLMIDHTDEAFTISLKAQITSCSQTNFPETVVFGDWDWTGIPRQQDETNGILYVEAEPSRTIDTTIYVNEEFSYRDSTYVATTQGKDTLHWYFHNTKGYDSLIVVNVQVLEELDPCMPAVDFEGHIYPSVRIGPLCWMQENLRSRYYSDGRPISNPRAYNAFGYADVARNEQIFGLLYSWQDAVDTSVNLQIVENGRIHGICPNGWFLPKQTDYDEILQYGVQALRVPEYWLNGGGNNSIGFSALPAGFYNGESHEFERLLSDARFWSCNYFDHTYHLWQMILTYYCSEGLLQEDNSGNGYSVRCVRP